MFKESRMDFETVSPEDFGASLKGFGLNLLVTDVKRTAIFLETVFGMAAKRLSTDFAILTHGENILQLLRGLSDETGTALVLVTHSPEAARICHREIHLRDGEIAWTRSTGAEGPAGSSL